MKVIVRDFFEADRATLREVFVAARDTSFSWAPLGVHQLEDFDASTAGEKILAAEVSCTPIGFASIWRADNFLHNLFVHPQHQGFGVGKALLAGCDKYFSGIPRLKCLKANERAKQFYQSQGWSVCSEAEGWKGPVSLWHEPAPTVHSSRTRFAVLLN